MYMFCFNENNCIIKINKVQYLEVFMKKYNFVTTLKNYVMEVRKEKIYNIYYNIINSIV
ncbi:MAG: hypothetical protein K0Q97_759 [Bacillota bacterium]|jgi:hypothetical protein|nr:hypothetical protein [Bacillota bacterium]